MCMFKFANTVSNKAKLKGVEFFECGSCPECLQKKSRKWALRCAMEAKVSPGVMVTLTYDTYKYASSLVENPTDPTIPLSKEHCQKFIKRLRKRYPDKNIKYILCAERGKRTGRSHYHALLFNVQFDDLVPIKKSKRGNQIYRSKTLEQIWSHGICTVDCVNLSAKTARYCTKYCAKDSGVDDTFMLFSRGIGDELLKKRFNGKSYWLEGREYSIPREIWQWYIESKYNLKGYSKYVGEEHLFDFEKKLCNKLDLAERRRIKYQSKFDLWDSKYKEACANEHWIMALRCCKMLCKYDKLLRQISNRRRVDCDKIFSNFVSSPHKKMAQQDKRLTYMMVRDADPLYQDYIEYWSAKNRACEFNRPSDIERLYALPDNKYWSYKQKAISSKLKQVYKRDFVPPRSNIQAFLSIKEDKSYNEKSFAPLSRHYTANDTEYGQIHAILKRVRALEYAVMRANAKRREFTPF